MGFPEDGLTQDLFLGGLLRIWQPKNGYRAGVDPVLLAASVPAAPGETVLELGCGAGVASLCLGRRVPGLRLSGLELQKDYAELARRNAGENQLDFTIHTGDLAGMPMALKSQRFNHVIANPPYYIAKNGTAGADAGRARALREQTPLSEWVNAASRRLAPKGHFSVIQDVQRLPELMAAVYSCLGSIEVWPLAARHGRATHRVLLRARKEGRAAFILHPPFLMHNGPVHRIDGDDYTPAIRDVLRHGAALPFSCSKRG